MLFPTKTYLGNLVELEEKLMSLEMFKLYIGVGFFIDLMKNMISDKP